MPLLARDDRLLFGTCRRRQDERSLAVGDIGVTPLTLQGKPYYSNLIVKTD
jgi:hypothetical protein